MRSAFRDDSDQSNYVVEKVVANNGDSISVYVDEDEVDVGITIPRYGCHLGILPYTSTLMVSDASGVCPGRKVAPIVKTIFGRQ